MAETAKAAVPHEATAEISASAADKDAGSGSLYRVIAVTGGPCGGKTSSLTILGDLFIKWGWKVYTVPETASMLINAGVSFVEMSPEMAYSFQRNLLKTLLATQDTFIELAQINAKKGIKTMVICDRGAMDPSAYMPRDQWLRALDELNLDEVSLRDHRYDCVIHMVTAAKGAPQFYTVENNTARTETLEAACEMDQKVMQAWMGHASLTVIENVSVANFREKCDRAVQAVLNRIGGNEAEMSADVPLTKRKFLVSNFKFDDKFPLSYRDFVVEHVYLTTAIDGDQVRIRKREEIDHRDVHYSITTRHPAKSGQRVETRRNLTPKEYQALYKQKDVSRSVIQKRRRCFLYEDRYFQLDWYASPQKGLTLLESYMPTSEAVVTPSWLEVKEVTSDSAYSMYMLAKT